MNHVPYLNIRIELLFLEIVKEHEHDEQFQLLHVILYNLRFDVYTIQFFKLHYQILWYSIQIM